MNLQIIVPAQYGQPFNGGFYAGKVKINDDIFGIAVAPKALGDASKIWLPSYEMVDGAQSCFDSMANTLAMQKAGSPAAEWALSLDIDGNKSWCLPARDVLEICYRNLKPTDRTNLCSFRDGDNASSIPVSYPYTENNPQQTVAEAFRKGNSEAFEEEYYWSSTQRSDYNAYVQSFSNGLQSYGNLSAECRVRAVSLIQLSA